MVNLWIKWFLVPLHYSFLKYHIPMYGRHLAFSLWNFWMASPSCHFTLVKKSFNSYHFITYVSLDSINMRNFMACCVIPMTTLGFPNTWWKPYKSIQSDTVYSVLILHCVQWKAQSHQIAFPSDASGNSWVSRLCALLLVLATKSEVPIISFRHPLLPTSGSITHYNLSQVSE